jgi:hypothetical protein
MLLYCIPFVIIQVSAYLSCGSVDYPTKPEDCTSKSTNIRSCCYAQYNDGRKVECADFVDNRTGIFTENNVGYTCPEANFNQTISLSLFCGPQNPISVDDCSKFSSDYNTCCYMKYQGENYCINLGRKFSTTIELLGDQIACSQTYLGISMLLLLFIII